MTNSSRAVETVEKMNFGSNIDRKSLFQSTIWLARTCSFIRTFASLAGLLINHWRASQWGGRPIIINRSTLSVSTFKVYIAVLIVLCLAPNLYAQDSEESLMNQARASYDLGNFPGARIAYQQYLDSYPEGQYVAEASYKVGDCFYYDEALSNNQRYQKAIAQYEIVLATYADDDYAPYAYQNLAMCYIIQGLTQDAIIQLRRARDTYPSAPNATDLHRLIAEAYYALEDYRQAAILHQSFMESNPDSPHHSQAKLRLGICCFRLGNFERADNIFSSLNVASPELMQQFPSVKFAWAESMLSLNKLDHSERLLKDILADGRAKNLHSHSYLRMGDLYQARAKIGGKEENLRLAAGFYHLQYKSAGPELISYAALMRLIEVADETVNDVWQELEIQDADTLLNQSYEFIDDAELRALVLARLAQHHRTNNRPDIALEYYKRLVDGYSGFKLTEEISSAYRQYVRSMIHSAFEENDFSSVANYYLGYGNNVELSTEEKLMLAMSFVRTQLYDRALAIFDQLSDIGLDSPLRRSILLERTRIHFARREFDAAENYISSLLDLDPLPKEREDALLMRQEILFLNKNLPAIQYIYNEQQDQWATPVLKASLLVRMGTLYFIGKRVADAKYYLELFMQEFGSAMPDDQRIVENIFSGMITLGDIYILEQQYDEAVLIFERYIFNAALEREIAWALIQAGTARKYLGQKTLAIGYFREFLDKYPEHRLRPLAEQQLAEIIAQPGN